MKGIAQALVLATAWHAMAQSGETQYPNMAPVEQYLMEDRNSEIALARSAAPESISAGCRDHGSGTSRLRNHN
jgi:hypothetical protein